MALRKRGFDVIHAQERDRKGLSDVEHLAYAIEQRRCLLSFNTKDFVLLHNEYVEHEKEHWGIIVSKQRPIGETLSRVLKVLQRFSRQSMKNRIEFL
ncbi:DUF5615 family PIN-like protein [candidate division KSB1 bacterium]|nr:DUF5615 family PIN-like protein [candidate division KSB1 bacterium]